MENAITLTEHLAASYLWMVLAGWAIWHNYRRIRRQHTLRQWLHLHRQ